MGGNDCPGTLTQSMTVICTLCQKGIFFPLRMDGFGGLGIPISSMLNMLASISISPFSRSVSSRMLK